MSRDKDFLMWIYHRLIQVYDEDRDIDYMVKLRSLIDNMPDEIPYLSPKKNESEIRARKRTPVQSVYLDDRGSYRFVTNHIVRYLLDEGPFDLNHLARVSFTADDRRQFAQLIGYSISGYGDLGYVDDATYSAAYQMAKKGFTEEQAKIVYYEELINNLRISLREPMAGLFGKHPDDLMETENGD